MAVKKRTSTTTTDTKPAETKNQKFVRLANSRVPRACKYLLNIGNLGGPGYESTDEQRKKIEQVLTEAVTNVVTRLNGVEKKATPFAL